MNQRANDGIKQFLEALSVDTEASELEKTPSRVTELYSELFSGVGVETKSVWGETFSTDYKGLIAVTGIPFYSMCEHHLLPFFGTVDIVYLLMAFLYALHRLSCVCLLKELCSKIQR